MDFEIIRGDSQILKFQLKDKNGEVLQLADGDKLYFTVKKTPRDEEFAIQKRTGNGIILSDDGYYRIPINPSDTSDLEYGDYGYDIELKTNEGFVKTLTIGTISLSEEYTFRGNE